jgi:hypothetical protein
MQSEDLHYRQQYCGDADEGRFIKHKHFSLSISA